MYKKNGTVGLCYNGQNEPGNVLTLPNGGVLLKDRTKKIKEEKWYLVDVLQRTKRAGKGFDFPNGVVVLNDRTKKKRKKNAVE